MESLAYLHLAVSVEVDLPPIVATRPTRDCCSRWNWTQLPVGLWVRLLAISANLIILSIAAQVYALPLQQGSEGSEVAALQRCLLNQGYLDTSTFGYFGPKTEAAVLQFQRERGLSVDGVVGSATAAALGCNLTSTTGVPQVSYYPPAAPYYPDYPSSSVAQVSPYAATTTRPILRRGDRGVEVSDLQRRLKSQGYYTGAIDGDFGPGTERAVIQFQQAANLRADGVVGATTWTALGVQDDGSRRDRLAERFSVLALQQQLKAKGFYGGQIDGQMGPETQRAIAAAQRFYGVSDSEILSGRLPR